MRKDDAFEQFQSEPAKGLLSFPVISGPHIASLRESHIKTWPIR